MMRILMIGRVYRFQAGPIYRNNLIVGPTPWSVCSINSSFDLGLLVTFTSKLMGLFFYTYCQNTAVESWYRCHTAVAGTLAQGSSGRIGDKFNKRPRREPLFSSGRRFVFRVDNGHVPARSRTCFPIENKNIGANLIPILTVWRLTLSQNYLMNIVPKGKEQKTMSPSMTSQHIHDYISMWIDVTPIAPIELGGLAW